MVEEKAEEKKVEEIENEKQVENEKPVEVKTADKTEIKDDKKTDDLTLKCKKCGYTWSARKTNAKKYKCPLCGGYRIQKPNEVNKVDIEVAEKLVEKEIEKSVDEKLDIDKLLEEEPKKNKGFSILWYAVAIFIVGLVMLFFHAIRKKPIRNDDREGYQQTEETITDLYPLGLR